MFPAKFKLQKLFVFILASTFSYASDYLEIQDPQSWWRDGRGTIEEATLSVKPKGLYMECGLYLTISGRDLGFGSQDTMEIVYQFELPDGAIVTDSWLWVENEIIRGKLLDKWTASSIYEDIVKRRRDPSILFKRDKTQYELRIFPMAGNESRKVKITFLLPANWTAKTVSCALPVNMLNVSKFPIPEFHVLSWPNDQWQNPRLVEFPDNNFQTLEDEELGAYLRLDIPSAALGSILNYSVDAPFTNGAYVNTFSAADENFYQLAVLPADVTEFGESSKKVAFLFDHLFAKSDEVPTAILNNVKEILHSGFSAKDSFNLIFTNLDIERTSELWIAADSAQIELTFANLQEDVISNYSSLPALLSNGIDFIQENGNSGSIFLLSSSDQLGDYTAANDLLDDLLTKMDPLISIHVADYANWNAQYYWIGGRYYRGNEYFYKNISRQTAANYLTTRSGKTLAQVLIEIAQSFAGFMTSFDMHTTLENGFCYGRYNLQTSQTVYINKPILQVGKYNGSFPFNIEFAGEFNNTSFSSEIIIHDEQVTRVDSLNEEIWFGRYIQSLEKEEQTNDIINEIVRHSLDERILSLYTAFLCLEPSRGGEVCYDCLDESTVVTAILEDKTVDSDSLIQVYPNPFNSQTKIQIDITKFEDLKNLTFKIYSVTGQVVKTFNKQSNIDNKLTLTWNGENNNGTALASGTYFFVANSNRNRIVRKILLLK